jgi:hypothetical protein
MQLKLQRLYRWAAKRRTMQFKIKRPTLKEAIQSAMECHDLLKFCQNIIAAHQTGAFGGKGAL